MSELAQKSCTACRGGVPPLTREEAAAFMADAPGWSIEQDGTRIVRDFRFKNFAGALDFVNRVGRIAEEERHHPDIAFGWGYAKVTLYTHKIGGLHENDFIMAAKINELEAA